MHSFLVKEHLKTKCPKLWKIPLADICPFWEIPVLVGLVVVAMVIVITSVIGGFS